MQSVKSIPSMFLRSSAAAHGCHPFKQSIPRWSFGFSSRTQRNAIRSEVRRTSTTSDEIQPQAQSILKYWLGDVYESKDPLAFRPEIQKKWFMGGPKVDEEILRLFGDDIRRLENGEYDDWKEHPYNALASIVIMDQFIRCVYRGTAKMCCMDEKCFGLARHLVDSGRIKELKVFERTCVFLPYMHREDLQAQRDGVLLYKDLLAEVAQKSTPAGSNEALIDALEQSMKFAQLHLDVIEKYGRFPHRNVLLGRSNTPQEENDFKEGVIPKF